MADEQSLGVCVVGLGKGMFLARALSLMDDVRLYLCDLDAERLTKEADELRVAGTFPFMELAADSGDVGLLIASLPHHLHVQAAEVAARYGKHFVSEKPIARTLDEADRMIHVCREAGVRLMVAENQALLTPVHETRRLIEEGVIGKPFLLRVCAAGYARFGGWRWDRKLTGGGVLMDSGVHYIRILRLLGGEVSRVYAQGRHAIHQDMGGEDTAMVQLTFAGGAMGDILCSWGVREGETGFVFGVWGDEGTITCRSDALYLRSSKVAGHGDGLVRLPGIAGYMEAVHESFSQEARAFVEAILEDQEAPLLSPEEARKDLAVTLAAYQSMDSGQAVDVPVRNP